MFLLATLLEREECDPAKSSRILKLGAGEDSSGLLERLNLLIAARLTDLEVLHDEIAAGVQLTVGFGEIGQLLHGVVVALSVLHEILVGLGLLLGLFDDLGSLVLNGGVAVLDEVLVTLLGILLCNNGLVLHGLSIIDDGLNHALDTASLLVLAVVLEAGHWRRVLLGLLEERHLVESGVLLVIEALQDLKGGLQQLLGCALICNGHLELLVLLLTVLTGTLHLRLHLSDLRLEIVEIGSELLDVHVEVIDAGLEVVLLTSLLLGRKLVLVELLNAEILVLDLISLLLGQGCDHIGDCLLDLLERIKAHLRGKICQGLIVGLGGDLLQDCSRISTAGGFLGSLQEIEGLGEHVVRLVRGEDCESLGACFHLQVALLGPCLILCVNLGAKLLQHHQKLLIFREGGLGVFQVLFGLGVCLISVSKLLSLLVDLILTSLNLSVLGCFDLIVGVLLLHLHLLGVSQVGLESLLHLLQDAKDLSGGGSVRAIR